MSILFVIWNNDIGRGILDSKGLFPDELKAALSVNRNAHAPETEAHQNKHSLGQRAGILGRERCTMRSRNTRQSQ